MRLPREGGNPRKLMAWMPVYTGMTLRQEPINRIRYQIPLSGPELLSATAVAKGLDVPV